MSGSFGEMGNLLRQAQEMQRHLDRVKRELEQSRVEGTAGGGAVRVLVDGNGQVQKVTISPDAIQGAIQGGDPTVLEDLVLAATRDGIQRAADLRAQELSKVTGGLNLPGLF